jgi:hypothetical protein
LTYADLDQAIGRIHRFGQERECLVTMFVLAWDTAGDEKLLEALLHWRDISDIVLDGKEGGSNLELDHFRGEPTGPEISHEQFRPAPLREDAARASASA